MKKFDTKTIYAIIFKQNNENITFTNKRLKIRQNIIYAII